MSYRDDDRRLPDGWTRAFDPKTQHDFWVDTQAKPPRSIWVHPYEDKQFLDEHPGILDNLKKSEHRPPSDAVAAASPPDEASPPPDEAPPPPDEAPPPYTRRHSYTGPSSGGYNLDVPHDHGAIETSQSQPGTPMEAAASQQRNFLGKLKDKAIGTKEEREAQRQEHKRRKEERKQQLAKEQLLRKQQFEQQLAQERLLRQQRLAEQQRMYAQQQQHQAWPGQPGYGPSGFGQPYGQSYGQPMYAAPAGGRLGQGRFGGGGMGMGLPILGGLAGGLLLGSMFDGGWGDGGGGYDGGGGFDGGGFDGGGDF